MAVTEFRSKLDAGAGYDDAVTITMIADDTSIALWGPVILADGSITALPHAASTTTASDQKVIGVCVRLPRNGTLVADTTIIEVCIFGRCKLKVNDSTVNLNDSLVTHTTAGEAAVRAQYTVGTSYTEANLVTALDGIRACFAIALTTVTSGADSIILVFVNISCYPGGVAE